MLETEHYKAFKTGLYELELDGKLHKAAKNLYQFEKVIKAVTGVLAVTTKGFGFVELEDGSEVFIPLSKMNTAINGDTVSVEITKIIEGRNPEGQILDVIARNKTEFVGTFTMDRFGSWVIPEDKYFTKHLTIPHEFLHEAKDGQIVVVELLKWEAPQYSPVGKIIEILGDVGDSELEYKKLIREYDLPYEWTDKALQQAKNYSQDDIAKETNRRVDLRNLVCFTIDPKTAKDFDDAVSVEKVGNGWRLGVHIADVSHYVTPGSPIDIGARKRGTSIYFVGSVLHMLPNDLSETFCSLKPKVDRLAMTCMMDISLEGSVTGYEIFPSTINSNQRFTYEDVQSILNGDLSHGFSETLLEMNNLRKMLFKIRMGEGSIDLDLPESEIILADDGFPIAIHPSDRLESHRLVEEFMLLANQTVADFFMKHSSEQKKIGLYRIHEEPSREKVTRLSDILTKLEIKRGLKYPVKPSEYQEVIELSKNSQFRHFIEKVALTSMSKAFYSTRQIGHFGLAFKHYTHFTSPIRRYPDLIVHRILKSLLKTENWVIPKEEDLEKTAKHCSAREIIATKVERNHLKYKQLQWLSHHVGEEFTGVISGILPIGFFVELSESLVEGLVHMKSLTDDWYEHREDEYAFVGRRTGQSYRMGDQVNIRVASVQPSQGFADFELLKSEKDIKIKTHPRTKRKYYGSKRT